VGWFFHFSYLAGVPAAIVLFCLLFYLAYSWSKRRAERERKRLKL
jgi:hypothetical protein